MISTAFAQDAATAAEANAPFYHNPTFWVAVAFVLFIALVGKKIYVMISAALDDRAETIRRKIDEAAALREEAQQLLAANQRKQRAAQEEAEAIVQRARDEAKRIEKRSADDLERSLARREQLAKERIAQAEARAIAEVRAAAADIALSAARKVIADTMSAQKANALIDNAIKELPEKLH